MRSRPEYFESIRKRAAQRWDQLESDPELAGPWHQLFKQVQSPRHVLSELLQNADDAGATEASVCLEDNAFVFSHNGEDFKQEHFQSLCRFGYSNKRALHTIGFRGIGFKSTFSLGDVVELQTPSLTVVFNRSRFTEPHWVNANGSGTAHTRIRVAISDSHRFREIERNLQDWLKSPVSLLFFKSIRRLRIGQADVHWKHIAQGPIPESEWMALDSNIAERFLLVRSNAEPFPADSLAEIKQERLLGIDQETDFPPCKVELVLGAKGRLFVVLPTGVETSLPFACNAPFIQDPARVKIKDPETSPTNRWLLQRVGTLAATAMLTWLEKASLNAEERAIAYGMFPEDGNDSGSLESECAAAVESTFISTLDEKSYLLTTTGQLRPEGRCIAIPDTLFDVWPADQVASLLDHYAKRDAFSQHVSARNRNKLIRRKCLASLSKDDVLAVLRSKNLPRPDSWRSLLTLWTYVAPELTGYELNSIYNKDCNIIPVQGKDTLHSANTVVRLGEKKLLQSDADWEFLASHLLVMNPNWPRFLAEQRRSAEESGDAKSKSAIDAAMAIQKSIGLEDASDVSAVIEQVAGDVFGQQSVSLSHCAQMAQIAAKLGVTTAHRFRFATTDAHLRSVSDSVVFDIDGTLESLLPEEWRSAHLLHDDYTREFRSCTAEEWIRWIRSGRAGVHTFVPLARSASKVWSRSKLEELLLERGCKGGPSYPYVTSNFTIVDWDFHNVLWSHWNTLAANDSNFWGRLLERILEQPVSYWSKCQSAEASQVATTSNSRSITDEPLVPAWILKLRSLKCLPDTRGFYHKPADLFRRTPETESLMDVEPFVHGRLDTEANRPLLILLGLRDTPTGPARLLDCLRALARAEKPPVLEVEKWYRRLDQMVSSCGTTDFAAIKAAFRDEKLILTDAGAWAKSSGVFLSPNEDDVPGAETIRASVKDFALWSKISVEQRPTADLAIQWLKGLPPNNALPPDDVRRVRALLTRHAARIWNECGQWLSLSGEWVPTSSLCYSLSMRSLIPWSHLYESVKRKTADFQRLDAETVMLSPFRELPPLASHVEDRFVRDPSTMGGGERKPWLLQVGSELRRLNIDDGAQLSRIRSLADDLTRTTWRVSRALEIVPYVDGVPAGTARKAEVVWLDRVLYVDQLPNAKLARLVPDRLGKYFERPDIAAALHYCYGRSTQEVTEYFEENFDLLPRELVVPQDRSGTAQPRSDAENASASQPIQQNEPPATDSVVEVTPEPTPEPAQTVDPDQPVENTNGQGEPGIPQPKPRIVSHPPKPSIMERFSAKLGFRQNGDGCFAHADGSRIAKAKEDYFPWERIGADGTVTRRYWPRDHCLEREPLQVEADVWGLIDKFPETYAFVLSNPQEEPVEVSGEELRTLRDQGKLVLYPATYRLVYDHDKK